MRASEICQLYMEQFRTRGGGGGGQYFHVCMHIEYVPPERPPFSALNFRSGAYNFHKLPKIRSGASPFKFFFADFAVPETIIFKISLISTRSSPPTAGSARTLCVRQRRGLAAGQSVSQTRPGSSGDSHFHAQNRIKPVPQPCIFTLKTAQARSGAPHFHARPGARSGAWAHFSLCRGTYMYLPPPPPPTPDSESWRLCQLQQFRIRKMSVTVHITKLFQNQRDDVSYIVTILNSEKADKSKYRLQAWWRHCMRGYTVLHTCTLSSLEKVLNYHTWIWYHEKPVYSPLQRCPICN